MNRVRMLSALLPWCMTWGCGSEITLTTPDGPVLTSPTDRPDDVEPPIASCAASPLPASPMQAIDLIGEDSYDPDNIPLINWRWSLISTPEGSATYLPDGAANRKGLVPDLLGEYAANLIVTNDRGRQSELCAVSFEVTTPQRLWIELYWQYAGDDLDLHIVRDDGTEPSEDCYPGACNHDWGTIGVAIDDPSVLRDDVEDVGPELAGIEEPRDSTYDIYVYDQPGSVRRADNIAVMNVYIDGLLAWTGFKTIEDEGTVVPFVRVDWSAGTVTPL